MSAFRSVAACLILLSPGLVASVSAQQATPPAKSIAKKVRSLADVLDKLDWDVAQRGPLLIVAPDLAMRPKGQIKFNSKIGEYMYGLPPEVPKPGRNGLYRATTIDGFFGRKIQPFGTLTALVPEKMTILLTDLPAPNPYTILRPEERLRLLQSRLTPEQWKRIASQEGLSANDLSGDNRNLFLSVLPNPFVVSVKRRANVEPEVLSLTEAQRANVHISLYARMQWTYGTENGWSVGMTPPALPRTFPYLNLLTKEDESDYLSEMQNLAGVSPRKSLPNRLKPGDLDFAEPRFDKVVSLIDAKTVGDLVQRIANVSGVELYADFRYASLPVHVRGDAVRASDLLNALCLSVTGTFRKVTDGKEEAFVLTYDREGMAVTQAKLYDWVATARTLWLQCEREAKEAARESKPLDYVRYQPGDPLAPDEKLRQRIAKQIEDSKKPAFYGANPDRERLNRERSLWVPVTQLPPAALPIIKESAKNWEINRHQDGPNTAPLQTETVKLDVYLKSYYVIPGLGRMEMNPSTEGFESFNGIPSLLSTSGDIVYDPSQGEPLPNPYPLPSGFVERGALCTVATAQEATQVARLVVAKGLNQLWLDIPTTMAPESLAAIVKAVKDTVPELTIHAVVRPLRLPESDETNGVADRNVLGETRSEWIERVPQSPLSPADVYDRGAAYLISHEGHLTGDFVVGDAPDAWKAITARLAAFAKTPGLSGFVLQEKSVPGYDTDFSRLATRRSDWFFGYTPTNRLAFLRAYGADPTDILLISSPSIGHFTPLSVFQPPFLAPDQLQDTDAKKREEWGQFRRQIATNFEKRLYNYLKETLPAGSPPLYTETTTEQPYPHPIQFHLWEPSSGKEPDVPGRGIQKGVVGIVASPVYFYNVAGEKGNTKKFVRALDMTLKEWLGPGAKTRPSGYLLDLSEMPLPDALKTLESLSH